MHALDLDAVRCDFNVAAAHVAPDQLARARQTLERIPPARWSIEWHLPWWLGEAFGLDEPRARQFVLSNVLGLASIRLRDDVEDGEIPADERQAATALASALHNAALDIYRPSFPPPSPFWEYVLRRMRDWRAATRKVNLLQLADLRALRAIDGVPARCLADLGAPLKISACAICALTGNQARLPALERLLDHALLAAVLNDHALDWDQDLASGRWNLFVAALSPLPQTDAFRNENRARVMQAWMLGNSPRVYYNRIARHVQQARQASLTLRIPALETHFALYLEDVWRTHDAMERHYCQKLAHATQTFFGSHDAATREKKEGNSKVEY